VNLMADALRLFAVSAFHQDYDLDSPTPDDAVLQFIGRSSEGTMARLLVLVEELLASTRTEDEFDDLWINQLHANYDPRDDGLTYREWFAHVRDLLTQAKAD